MLLVTHNPAAGRMPEMMLRILERIPGEGGSRQAQPKSSAGVTGIFSTRPRDVDDRPLGHGPPPTPHSPGHRALVQPRPGALLMAGQWMRPQLCYLTASGGATGPRTTHAVKHACRGPLLMLGHWALGPPTLVGRRPMRPCPRCRNPKAQSPCHQVLLVHPWLSHISAVRATPLSKHRGCPAGRQTQRCPTDSTPVPLLRS
jgi:hypothetical protein